MQLVLVCAYLVTTSLATTSFDSEGTAVELRAAATSYLSMPVQFSMAAPLPHTASLNNPYQAAASSPIVHSPITSLASSESDWIPSPVNNTQILDNSESSASSFSSRRGYLGHSRPRRKKYRIPHDHHPHPEETGRPLRRHPPYREMAEYEHNHPQRTHSRYPPYLASYSHNYKMKHPPYPPGYRQRLEEYHKFMSHLYRPEHHDQYPLPSENAHHSYEEYPPYASKYVQNPPLQTHHPAGFPQNMAYPQPASHFQTSEQNSQPIQNVGFQTQSSLDEQNSQQPVTMPQNAEFANFATQFQNGEAPSTQVKNPSQNYAFPSDSVAYQPNELQSNPPNSAFLQQQQPEPPYQPPQYSPTHTHTSSQYFQSQSQYSPEKYSRYPYPSSYLSPSYSTRPVSQSYENGYNPEFTNELLEYHKDVESTEKSSGRSIYNFLLPLLMLGVSIPAIGYMYSHMLRRRSMSRSLNEYGDSDDGNMEEYMNLLQRAIKCYDQNKECL